MSLREAFDSAKSSHTGMRCRTCVFAESLSGDDRVVLEEFLSDTKASSSLIASALKSYGFEVSLSALSRHRRDCR